MPEDVSLPLTATLFQQLNALPKGKSIDLPIEFREEGLGLAAAVVGNDVRLPLEIDSTALSMTLRDHLHAPCNAFPCTVWIRGTWGPLLGEVQPSQPILTVRDVLGPVETDAKTVPVGRP